MLSCEVICCSEPALINMLVLFLSWLFQAQAQCSVTTFPSSTDTLVERSAGLFSPSVLVANVPAAWITLSGARWIWESDSESVGVFTFLATFTVPEWSTITSVKLLLAADDCFAVIFNGVTIASEWTGDYTAIKSLELGPWLQVSGASLGTRPNRLEIRANNTSGPGGLLYKVEIR